MTAGRIARELWWTSQEFSPASIIISPWLSMLIYHLGMNNRPVGVSACDAYSHPIDIINQSMITVR
jgi:hypothetical protein